MQRMFAPVSSRQKSVIVCLLTYVQVDLEHTHSNPKYCGSAWMLACMVKKRGFHGKAHAQGLCSLGQLIMSCTAVLKHETAHVSKQSAGFSRQGFVRTCLSSKQLRV